MILPVGRVRPRSCPSASLLQLQLRHCITARCRECYGLLQFDSCVEQYCIVAHAWSIRKSRGWNWAIPRTGYRYQITHHEQRVGVGLKRTVGLNHALYILCAGIENNFPQLDVRGGSIAYVDCLLIVHRTIKKSVRVQHGTVRAGW